MSNRRVSRTVPKIIAVSAAVAACASIQVLAQPAGNGAAGNDQNGAAANAVNGDQLAEVVVTAEKRTENLQALPQTVTAVSGTEMLQEGVKDITDLSRVAPEVTVNTGQLTNVGIRGIKTNSFGPTLDSANAVYVDGNYNARFTSLNGLFFDMQRIEVLDGPQGTLYGRNSAGGAINIISNKPTQTFGGYGWIEVGNYNDVSLTGALNLPLSDTWAFRIAYMRDSHSGFETDSGQDAQDLQGGRAELLWKPSANDSLLLTAQESTLSGKISGASTITRVFQNPDVLTDTTTGNVVTINPASGPNQTGVCPKGDTCTSRVVPINVTNNPRHNAGLVGAANLNYDDTYNDAFAAQYDHGFGNFANLTVQAARMSSVTSASGGFVSNLDQNPTLVAAGLFGGSGASGYNSGAGDHHTWDSQEMRLTSIATTPLQWVLGLYRYDEIGVDDTDTSFVTEPTTSTAANAPVAAGSIIFPANSPVLNNDIPNLYSKDEARSIFGQATWTPSFSSRLHLTGGIRYNDEYKHGIVTMTGSAVPFALAAFGPSGTFNASNTWRATTQKETLSYDLTSHNMVYIDHSTGFQSGGFGYGGAPEYQPTHIWAWEIGSKNRFFDDSLQVNVSAWYYDYSNQTANISDVLVVHFPGVPFPIPVSFITVSNAGTAIDRGQSLDLQWNLTHDDQLGVNVQHLNDVYTNFNLTNNYLHQAAQAGTTFAALYPGYSATGNQSGPSFNYDGTRVGNTPDLTVYGTYGHTFRWDDRSLTAQVIWRYVGSEISGNQEAPNMPPYNGFWTLPSYSTWDLNFTYTAQDGKYSITAFSRNLFNTLYATAVGYTNGEAALSPAASAYAYETESYGPPRQFGVQVQANF